MLFLSNYSEHVRKRSTHTLDFLPHLNGGVFSYQVHRIKPEPEIYRILLEKYELKAEECVFVDDNGKNIQAARELGFRTVHFENYEQAREALEELLREDGEADE